MTRNAGGRRGSSRRAVGVGLVTLFLGGVGLLGAGFNTTPPQPPQPAAEVADAEESVEHPDNSPTTIESTALKATPPAVLKRSEATRITIRKIGVDAKVIPLGVNKDGTVQVPPLNQAQLAGWYKAGPSPGEAGNAVIVGHVDSAKIGPAVFFRLGALEPGNIIEVTRKDGTVAKFAVDRVKSYPKTAFPTDLVYGPVDKPSLRLVTCGGQFDKKKRSYPDNIIAFATLVS